MTVQIAQIKVLASFILSAVYIFNKDRGWLKIRVVRQHLIVAAHVYFFVAH